MAMPGDADTRRRGVRNFFAGNGGTDYQRRGSKLYTDQQPDSENHIWPPGGRDHQCTESG